MYDPLKHFIAEGLVVLHSFPNPKNPMRLVGRFLNVRSVEIETSQPMGALGGYELRVKHGAVWFNYDVDDDFFKEYTTSVADKVESIEIERRWQKELLATRELVGDIVSA